MNELAEIGMDHLRFFENQVNVGIGTAERRGNEKHTQIFFSIISRCSIWVEIDNALPICCLVCFLIDHIFAT